MPLIVIRIDLFSASFSCKWVHQSTNVYMRDTHEQRYNAKVKPPLFLKFTLTEGNDGSDRQLRDREKEQIYWKFTGREIDKAEIYNKWNG